MFQNLSNLQNHYHSSNKDSPLDDDIQPCQLPPNLTIGLWVIVKYADEEYPGEVTSIEDSDMEVSVMHTM